MPKPLIPDDVRALYEALIVEGSRIIPEDDPQWTDPAVIGLLEAGLAIIVRRRPPVLAPVNPDAAFENMLARWVRPISSWQNRFRDALGASAHLHHNAIRSALQRGMGSQPIILIRSPQVTSLHAALSNAAQSFVRECCTGPYGEPRKLPSGDPHPPGDSYRSPNPDVQLHGGRNLILCDETHATEYRINLVNGHAAGEEIRVSPKTLPMKLLIVDDHTSLVPLGPYGKPCLLIRDRNLVSLFTELFDRFWDQSRPWEPDGERISATDTETGRKVLSGLTAGLKDEAIARQLGLSARTVRRHVSQIMRELGATTRFAAGVAAVRQGLVAKGAA